MSGAKCLIQVFYTHKIAAKGVAGWEEVQRPLVVGALRQDYNFGLLKLDICVKKYIHRLAYTLLDWPCPCFCEFS